MRKSKTGTKLPFKLRDRVEEFIGKHPAAIKKISPNNVRDLFEDLQTYQIELENQNHELQKAVKKLKESEGRFSHFLDNLGDAAYETDSSGNVTYANKMAETIASVPLKDIVGKPFLPLFTEKSRKTAVEVYQKTLEGERPEYNLTFANGRICHFKNEPLTDKDGNVIGVFGVARDITDHKHGERAFQRAYNELERKVKKRTKKLAIRNRQLEELNTALKVVLTKKDENKKTLEENILSNVNKLILPYLEKMKKNPLGEKQKIYLEIIESNLKEMVSPFSKNLSSKYIYLTPAEIQVADLVKHGKRTKEIAALLNLSVKTIESHRESIRKKIGIRNKKIHLRSYLLSLH